MRAFLTGDDSHVHDVADLVLRIDAHTPPISDDKPSLNFAVNWRPEPLKGFCL
jgi:hypothetical protein